MTEGKRMNPEIEELMKIISKAQEAIAAIRTACQHVEYKVAQTSWAPGHHAIIRLCLSCSGVSEGITDEEIRVFLEIQKKEITADISTFNNWEGKD